MEDNKMTFVFDDVDNGMDLDDQAELTVAPEVDVIVDQEEPAEESKPEESAEPEGISEDLKSEYLSIYDAIMFEDKFEKEYKLGKKYSATFSTRSTDADIRISRQLDSMDFATMHALQTMSAVLTMSHSLVSLNGTDLSSMSVTERYNTIRTKSSHLIELLSRHMISFDKLVRDALAYGEENF